MRLKKCVLSFLRKLVRDEISFMSDGNAFQARGPAVEKALSVTRSRVRETTKLPRTLDRSRVSAQRRTSSDRYCGAVPRLISSTQFELNSARHWQPVELLQKRWCMRPGGSTTEKSSSSVLHTLQTVECRLRSAGKQTVIIIQNVSVSVHVSVYTVS